MQPDVPSPLRDSQSLSPTLLRPLTGLLGCGRAVALFYPIDKVVVGFTVQEDNASALSPWQSSHDADSVGHPQMQDSSLCCGLPAFVFLSLFFWFWIFLINLRNDTPFAFILAV